MPASYTSKYSLYNVEYTCVNILPPATIISVSWMQGTLCEHSYNNHIKSCDGVTTAGLKQPFSYCSEL